LDVVIRDTYMIAGNMHQSILIRNVNDESADPPLIKANLE